MVDKLLDSVTTLIDAKLKKIKYDRTVPGVVYGKEGNMYLVPYENSMKKLYCAIPYELEVGTLVWLTIPSNNLRNMYISGLRQPAD